MILTIPVLLYQLLFVLILYVASRLGRLPLNIALACCLACCLAWTAAHIFFPPLMVLQGAVILASYFWFRRHIRSSQGS